MKKCTLALVGTILSSAAVADTYMPDFGVLVEKQLKGLSNTLFGFTKPLTVSGSGNNPRKQGQKADDIVNVAQGLKAEIVTRQAANNSDQFAFWPDETNPSHMIFCIEDGRKQLTGDSDTANYMPGDKFNPSIQRVNMLDGSVQTILRGMTSCDGVRRTAWGTILVTEETTGGGAYEILNPLLTTNYTVKDRTTGEIVNASGVTDNDEIVKRTALPAISWEGLDITAEGIVYGGDELRPGPNNTDGGSVFKFIPDTPFAAGIQITDLGQSPLISGSVYAYVASCQPRTDNNFPQFGQGCEIGDGAWLRVSATTARSDANRKGATGYYRPEDGHFNPMYTGPGIQFCWTNTGNENAGNYAEVICMNDTRPFGSGGIITKNGNDYLADGTGFAVAWANRVLEGDRDFNYFDNLEFQPILGNMYVVEDHEYGDIFACLQDGKDRDIKVDGCLKMFTIKDDGSSEPTGFKFSSDGRTAYLSIQHSNDTQCPIGSDCGQIDDYGTDDIIKITGFRSK